MPREQAIMKLVAAFRQYGYEGTTLTMLSQASNLGKASLYHHFPGGKSEMAQAALEYVGFCFSKEVLTTLEGDGLPSLKIEAMANSLKNFYDDGKNPCFLAIMSFGEADNLFHAQIKARLEEIIDKLAKVLIIAGIKPKIAQERSQDAMAKIQGALILVRILDDTEPFNQVIRNLPAQLLG